MARQGQQLLPRGAAVPGFCRASLGAGMSLKAHELGGLMLVKQLKATPWALCTPELQSLDFYMVSYQPPGAKAAAFAKAFDPAAVHALVVRVSGSVQAHAAEADRRLRALASASVRNAALKAERHGARCAALEAAVESFEGRPLDEAQRALLLSPRGFLSSIHSAVTLLNCPPADVPRMVYLLVLKWAAVATHRRSAAPKPTNVASVVLPARLPWTPTSPKDVRRRRAYPNDFKLEFRTLKLVFLRLKVPTDVGDLIIKLLTPTLSLTYLRWVSPVERLRGLPPPPLPRSGSFASAVPSLDGQTITSYTMPDIMPPEGTFDWYVFGAHMEILLAQA